jgi:RNase H-fold protein (predicted Holliday junction resolvase)
MIGFPHSGYRRGALVSDQMKVGRVVNHVGSKVAIVGLPRPPFGHRCDSLRGFIQLYSTRLLEPCGLRGIAFVDEAFSTIEATDNVAVGVKRSLRRDTKRKKQAIDSVSWVISCYVDRS